MQRIALIQMLGVVLAFFIPVFIGKEFYFLSLACVLSSTYFVIRGDQLKAKVSSSITGN